jgi:hypothetical protein
MFLHFNRAPLLLLSGKNKNPKIEHVRIKMCSNFFIFSHVQTYRCCFSPWFRSPRARSLCEPANCNTVSRIQQEGKEKAGKHFHVFCCLSLSLLFLSLPLPSALSRQTVSPPSSSALSFAVFLPLPFRLPPRSRIRFFSTPTQPQRLTHYPSPLLAAPLPFMPSS